MIFLEQTVNQILREEGQMLLKLSDLGISWDDLEQTFIGTYEQAKGYITIYDWVEDTITSQPQKKPQYTHIRHLTYGVQSNLQRAMPDVGQQFWEFNPYTKNMSSFTNTNFNLEVGMYPTLEQLEYSIDLTDIKKGKNKRFMLPCTPLEDITCKVNGSTEELDFVVEEVELEDTEKNDYLDASRDCPCAGDGNESVLQFMGDINGTFDKDSLIGNIKFNNDYDSVTMNITSKYVGIKELDLTCELFYKWFKSNVLMLIGSTKAQVDLTSSGLPFDFNADGVLDRAKELRSNVEELKVNKSHWSNF